MKYGSFTALYDVSIDVEAGEFLALLGPSGSGKSTMLMAIGGFNIPTSGDVIINDEVVTQKAPHLRNVGIVFQRYALFPHMTVWENVAYPLRRRRIGSFEIKKQVTQALEMVSLGDLAHRFPAELSGGQQQRVALARALVFHPPVLLMDEPLGALDRKLRQQLQMELKKLHRSLGTTIILVTHDQEEALSMADRVAVMAEGRLLQIGTPTELYCHPNSPFVADFIGESNFINVEVSTVAGDLATIKIPGIEHSRTVRHLGLNGGNSAKLAVRPEYFSVCSEGSGLAAIVEEVAFQGDSVAMLLSSQLGELKLKSSASQSSFKHGDRIQIAPDCERCVLFAGD
ncbi:ABC transporter ATP-binding protein [Rhizobium laguerreae]|uniref:ABC transporter ATP-binding protein n=1 Tax=Rhizobium laguerreae TaxID=1076926 RepID=UPI001C9227AA|nr:ABC transporter ATP-binding protein [Rhizobium laguerreae]MBY3258794.1 ABC transporter ATP-binding protein [Rhizobium laguerreae]MBY3282065.1 ABC transporter ATP-binding protein [Rhizobium laguerreae]MBY3293355.1 ABC transporter ATP-binding protein [Rhizobium laguerreae]